MAKYREALTYLDQFFYRRGVVPDELVNVTIAVQAQVDAAAAYALAAQASALQAEQIVMAPNAFLLDRANHTGVQVIGTVTDLQTTLDAKVAKAGEEQVISGGARVTPKDLGSIASGTVTIDPGDRGIQLYSNAGAHVLSPLAAAGGSCIVTITNVTGAGAITLTGWTKVTGDTLTTTVGHKFMCGIYSDGTNTRLAIGALQ